MLQWFPPRPDLEALTQPGSGYFSELSPITFPSHSSDFWLPHCSSNTHIVLPQNICACYSLCLDSSFLWYLHDLPPNFPPIFCQMSHSPWGLMATYLKFSLSSWDFISPFLNIYCIVYIVYFTYFLLLFASPKEVQAHVKRNFYLSYSLLYLGQYLAQVFLQYLLNKFIKERVPETGGEGKGKERSSSGNSLQRPRTQTAHITEKYRCTERLYSLVSPARIISKI